MSKDKDSRSVINTVAAKAAEKDIHDSTIPNEIKLMVQLANSCQVVVEDTFNRIKGVYAKHGFRPTNNEILKGLSDYCKAVKAAGWHFFNKIDPLITDATFYTGDAIKDGMTGVQRYDAFNGAANIGVRLLMLYADRIDNMENYSKLFKTLRQMPSRGVFADEDIARFTNKGKR